MSDEIQKSILSLEYVSLSLQDGVGIITISDPQSKVNTLNSKLIPQFEKVMSAIEDNSGIKAVIIKSGKKDCFVAGADIKELQEATSAEDLRVLSEQGQAFFNRIENLKKPVIAAIHGSCLGGGFELALACHYRIATNSSKTVLGLPEILLGLIPGAGGTQRLPRLIGLQKSLPLMLAGTSLKADKAYKLGIVDYVAEEKGLDKIAIEAAHRLVRKTLKKKVKKKGFLEKIEKFSLGRDFIFKKALQAVEEKTRGLYPAPKALLESVSYGLSYGLEKGLKKEAENFSNLAQTSESKGLISLYFAQTELKKNPYPKPKKPLKELGVLGAGLMGSGIGLVTIQKGVHVRLKDITRDSLTKGQQYVWKGLQSRVKRKSLTPFQANQTLSKLTTQTDYSHFNHCQLVIEAVFEDLSLKHKVLKEIEEHISDDCIFASNTSALPISAIASVSKRPENVIGMHYFSPVEKMPLLEIVVTDKTSDEARSLAIETGLLQGKTVIVVKDGPGFYTTRILAPFMDEAALVCLEGMGFHELDSIMKDFGFPVGPITLIDEVGIDVALHVGEDLGKFFGERVSSQDTSLLKQLVSTGALGRKAGKGFFVYEQEKKGKKQGQKKINQEVMDIICKGSKSGKCEKMSPEEIQKRLSYRMINEAAYCLEEGILPRPLEGDIGAVFGLGFPPFRGGPFRFADTLGASNIVNDLKKLQDKFGDRFKPCELLVEMANKGHRFYPKN